MKIKALIFALMLLIVYALSACAPTASVAYVSSPDVDMDIYYVDAVEIRVKTLNVKAGMHSVFAEWLKVNGLDGDYKMVGVRIKNEHFEQAERTGYKFVYDVYEYYFDADIAEFLAKEENVLLYESLLMTLNAADELLSGIVDAKKADIWCES